MMGVIDLMILEHMIKVSVWMWVWVVPYMGYYIASHFSKMPYRIVNTILSEKKKQKYTSRFDAISLSA